MGKYDMTSKYDKSYAVTIAELCNEILDEAEQSSGNQSLDSGLVRSKFHNAKGSGIIQKLKDVGFDVWALAGEDKCKKYEVLKILKMFYCIEQGCSSNGEKVNITRVLAEPCLDELEPGTLNGIAFQNLYEKVCGQIEDAEHYEQEIDVIDRDWKTLIAQFAGFLYCPTLVVKYDEILENLRKIGEQLWAIHEQGGQQSDMDDEIMHALLLLLAQYKVLAYNYSFSEAQEKTPQVRTAYDAKLAQGYRNKAIGTGDLVVTWEQIDAVGQNVKNDFAQSGNSASTAFLSAYILSYTLGAISGENLISEEERMYRANSFLYVKEIARWLQQQYQNIDFSKGIPLHVLAGIAQTIYYVGKNREKYVISARGGYKKRSLMAALQDREQAEKAAIFEWENRIAKRILTILGEEEMIGCYYGIQKALLKIENDVISHKSLVEIRKAHERLFPMAKGFCEWKIAE